jgi:hypothetical protein
MNINLGGNTLVKGYFAGIIETPCPYSTARWIVVNKDYTASIGNRIQGDTSGGAFTINLPSSASSGDKILIQDAKLSWNINNLTIAGGGLKINGASSNYTASIVGNKLSIVYISTSYGWSIK